MESIPTQEYQESIEASADSSQIWASPMEPWNSNQVLRPDTVVGQSSLTNWANLSWVSPSKFFSLSFIG
jgi:hypothetical protein